MPVVPCPIEDCTYATPDVDAIITTHATVHAVHAGPAVMPTCAKVEHVKRPLISSAGTSEDWASRQSYWLTAVGAIIAIKWHHRNQVLHQHLWRHLCTLFKASAPTFSNTWAYIT